jgi:PAS domain S-box-containing protein
MKNTAINLWRFFWLAVVLSVVFSLLLSKVIHGHVIWEYPFSATLIACIVATLLLFLLNEARKRQQSLAEESQAQFTCAFQDAAIGMALVSVDGQWLRVNSALCALTGYTEEELLSTTFQAITHPDDLEADLEFVRKMLQGTIRTYQMEKRYFHKLGDIVWTLLSVSLVRDQSGQPLYFIGQIQDISQRKEIEEQLRSSQMLFRAILDNSPNMIFLKNREGRYLLVNRRFENVFHLNEATILGKADDEIFPTTQAAIYQANDRKVLESGIPMEFEEPALHDDGMHTSIVFKFPLRDKRGAISSIGGITTDITARKRAEEALRESEQLLRVAFEEREHLSQDLHDHVIQSIYAIGMALETCLDVVDQNPQYAAAKLQKGISDLNTVIAHLRDYLEWGSRNKVKAVDFREALEDLVRTIRINEAFAVQLNIDPSVSEQLTDRVATHLLHIVREALTNTLRHSQARSSTVSLFATQEGIHLNVQDNGTGFEVDARNRTGWGLRNMAARAQELNARFQVISERRSGTRISLEIPRIDSGK